MARLELTNCLGILQGQTDVIQPVEQTVLAEIIHLERVAFAIRPDNGLRSQIDGQLITLLRFCLGKELVDIF